MDILALLILWFSTPEFPDYGSSMCILTATSFGPGWTYELQYGTTSSNYTIRIPIPRDPPTITCEDMGLVYTDKQQIIYHNIKATEPNGINFRYMGEMKMIIPAWLAGPKPPVTIIYR